MRVTNASGELVEVSADAVGLIGCSLGASSLLQLLALSKDTRKQRKAMLALVSHFKTSFRAPFPTNAARHAVRVDPEREMPLVEKTMRAYSDMTALHAAAHDMNVGKGALCWMLSEFIRAVDWKTLQQRVILAGDFKCLEDMIDTYFERTASTMAFGTVTHPSMVFGAPSPGFIEAIPYALVQQGAASVTVLKVLMDAQLRMLAKKYPRANVLSPTGTATVFHLHSESMMSGDVAMVQGNARFGYLTPLMLACRKGDLESVELMLTGRTTAVPGMDRTIALRACPDDEIDLDDVPRPPDASNCEGYTHAHGMTALMSTAKYGTIECMRLLLKRGVDVNKKEPSDHSRQGRFWGLTATGYACQEGRADCLQLLLDHGGAVDRDCLVLLFVGPAACAEHEARLLACLTILLDRLPQADFRKPLRLVDGLPLHLSISYSMPSCVKLLTERVPKAVNDAISLPDDRKHDGCTPLMYALLYSQGVDPLIHMLKMLLDAHADPNKGQRRATGGQTALQLAIMNNDAAAVELLLQAGANIEALDGTGEQTPLITAVMHRYTLIPTLITHGAAVDAVNKQGETALFRACTHAHELSVRALLAAGASVNFQPPGLHGTPLMCVIWRGSSTLLTLLLQEKADPNATNFSGDTALMIACHKFDTTLINSLVDAGAMCDTTDKVGRTALHWLAVSPYAGSNRQAAVQLLLANKACVNAQDADGQTALMKLCSANLNFPHRVDFMQALLDAGADRTIVDKEGMTAPHLCAANPKVNLGTRLQLMALLERDMDAGPSSGANSSANKRAKHE